MQLDSGKETITRLRLEVQRESNLAESGQPAECHNAIAALKEHIQQVPLPDHHLLISMKLESMAV